MNAAQALASIREDIDRLEAKDLVKPGFIRRKREEADAIEEELSNITTEVEQLKQQLHKLQKEHRDTDLRLGMLANVLSMAGLDPMIHLRRPLANNPDIYYHAARFVAAIRSQAGLCNRIPDWTLGEIKDIVAHAIWTARIHRATDPHTPIETLADGQYQDQEQHQAA